MHNNYLESQMSSSNIRKMIKHYHFGQQRMTWICEKLGDLCKHNSKQNKIIGDSNTSEKSPKLSVTAS